MTARRLAIPALALCLGMAALSSVLLVMGPGRTLRGDIFGGLGGASFVLLSLAFAVVGAIVARRVPGNRMGCVLYATGLVTGAFILAYEYGDHGLYAVSPPLPAAKTAAWLSGAPGEAVAGMFGIAVLLFPDGQLPSRRWRMAGAVAVLGTALLALSTALRPGSTGDPFAAVDNPIGVPGTRGLMTAVEMAGWYLAVAGIALGAVAMVVRRRRSSGVERQQLKLVLAVGSIVAATTFLSMTSWFIWPHGHLQARMAVIGVGLAAFPVAAGVAIMRYRLYDIDVVVNRALVYGALTAILAAAYLACVLVLQLALGPVTSGSSLAVAASTLAVAALFRPARSRIQGVVDRRFYRRKYDAARTLEGFSARLREQVDLDALGGELRGVVAETMQPAHVSLWLRGGGR